LKRYLATFGGIAATMRNSSQVLAMLKVVKPPSLARVVRSADRLVVLPVFLLALTLVGCQAPDALSPQAEKARASEQAVLSGQRQQLDQIPPPSKSRYMAVHSFDSWQNPYLTVQAGMLELHVTLADANPSQLGVGGMLRPAGARRQEVNISLDSLGEAVTSVPPTAWPYGRVIAIEEAHKVPASAEPAVRRNMEATINRLTDLGIVVYDIDEGKIQ
jgi:hypothetical protein